MNTICYIVGIRTRICQSGVPAITEKTYTNITSETVLILPSGYNLTLSRATNNSVNLRFTNIPLGFDFSFEVSNNTTNVFDIPLDSGTLRIAIFVSMRCCCN